MVVDITSTIKLHPLEPSRPGARGAMNAEQAALEIERDIHPLFRQEDVSTMSFAFDLASYEDVRTNAEAIYQRLADGSMPCDTLAARAGRALSRLDRHRIS